MIIYIIYYSFYQDLNVIYFNKNEIKTNNKKQWNCFFEKIMKNLIFIKYITFLR